MSSVSSDDEDSFERAVREAEEVDGGGFDALPDDDPFIFSQAPTGASQLPESDSDEIHLEV